MDALDAKGLLLEGTRKDLPRKEAVLNVPTDSSAEYLRFRISLMQT
jgi:hypothetical protein